LAYITIKIKKTVIIASNLGVYLFREVWGGLKILNDHDIADMDVGT